MKGRCLSSLVGSHLPLHSWLADIKHIAVHYLNLTNDDGQLCTPFGLGNSYSGCAWRGMQVFARLENFFTLDSLSATRTNMDETLRQLARKYRPSLSYVRSELTWYSMKNPSYEMPNFQCLLLEKTSHEEINIWRREERPWACIFRSKNSSTIRLCYILVELTGAANGPLGYRVDWVT